MQNTARTPQTAQPARQQSTPLPPGRPASSATGLVQLKRSLAGLDFDGQEAMLAPRAQPTACQGPIRGGSTAAEVQRDEAAADPSSGSRGGRCLD